jgi:hypothetical protein
MDGESNDIKKYVPILARRHPCQPHQPRSRAIIRSHPSPRFSDHASHASLVVGTYLLKYVGVTCAWNSETARMIISQRQPESRFCHPFAC